MLQKIFCLEGRVWSASLLNALAMALQLWTLLSTKDASGLSIPMLFIFFYVQVTFAQAGWKTKMWGQFWGMVVSATGTITIIGLALFIY